jgi:DNA-binding LacI/PurR family transcriptional regulator
MTVRKALEDLHREGWIERHTGLGSFVGSRINVPMVTRSPAEGGHRGPKVRMAVTIYNFGDLQHDWYTPQVLAGIDEVADACGVLVELLGDQERNIAVIGRRLAANRPDVLVMIAPAPWNLPIVGLGQYQQIPVLGTGTRLMPLGVPTVSEDSAQAMSIAVQHLTKQGHRRIGLVCKSDVAPWVYFRREGYLKAMADAGLPEAEELIFWPSYKPTDSSGRARHEQFDAYLQKHQPTAVVFTSSGEPESIQPLIESGKLSIPKDLSVIGMDQDPKWPQYLGGVKATHIALPIREMGRRLASMARAAIEGRTIETSVLACELVEGDSVLALPG